MNVSEYIFAFLKDKGVDTAFLVTGGQAMYLNDALCRTPEINPIFVHHEQVAGMSADAYSRMTGRLGLAVVTAGPGAMNITNGLVGAYMDSAPIMVISGQSSYACVNYMQESGIRQYGVQGINIRPFVEAGCKFFVTVDDPGNIRYYMEKAFHLALSGRPGPVWVDVPLDIQRMQVPERLLYGYTSEKPECSYSQRQTICADVLHDLKEARRPLLVAGQGIRLAGAVPEFLALVDKLRIPLITTRLGIDLTHSEHELYVGRPGNYGERSANFAVQNADLILALGSRLSASSVGHDATQFGRRAKKIVVDIDPKELNKPGVVIDTKVEDDVGKFMRCMLDLLGDDALEERKTWTDRCRSWRKAYPVVLPGYSQETPVNSYYFTQLLSEQCDAQTAVLVDTGSCFHVACQAWKVKKGQRFLTTGGLSSMGYWGAVLGACAANGYRNTVVITGDGSMQMNIQEFATVKKLNKPIKIFILNNNGYLLIRQTQRNFMDNRLFGEGPESGVHFPDSLKLAEAYGIQAVRIETPEDAPGKIQEVLHCSGPVVCDVITPEWQLIVPRVSSDKMPDGSLVARKYEDMFPYLPEGELERNMLCD